MTILEPSLADRVVRWQRSSGRHSLPWQDTQDPYRVWLSEIMLQQTQVSTVLRYYTRFLDRFPSVQLLANAGMDDVFALWSGLGYYSRARNLHRCAQLVVSNFDGDFPRNAKLLETLPGIGPSTAAAIASFCFGERVAILDANVKRVLTRALGFGADLAVIANERALWRLATGLLPHDDLAGTMPSYTQGLMDLGATVCTHRKPSCLICPLQSICVAQHEGRVNNYPVKTKKLKRSSEQWWILLARNTGGDFYLERRPLTGIWAGLYSPPVYSDHDALMADVPQHSQHHDLPIFLHVLTHKDLYLHPVQVDCVGGAHPMREGGWLTAPQWAALGLPAPIRKLLAAMADTHEAAGGAATGRVLANTG